jgi:hypothetical protein
LSFFSSLLELGARCRNKASAVSTKCLDSGGGRSAGILPANAAKMAALHCPANYWTLH